MTCQKRFWIVLAVAICILLLDSINSYAQVTPVTTNEVVAVANNWLQLGQEIGWGWTGEPDFSQASIEEIIYEDEIVLYSCPLQFFPHDQFRSHFT